MYAVARDPFARGEYERECHSNSDQSLDCQWCGQRPKRLYTYLWVNDGLGTCGGVRRQNEQLFCSLSCFRSHWS